MAKRGQTYETPERLREYMRSRILISIVRTSIYM